MLRVHSYCLSVDKSRDTVKTFFCSYFPICKREKWEIKRPRRREKALELTARNDLKEVVIKILIAILNADWSKYEIYLNQLFRWYFRVILV